MVFLWKKKNNINLANFYNIKDDLKKILREMDIYIDKENNN